MKARTITQIIHRYAIIDEASNEWLYEADTYGKCVDMVPAVCKKGQAYVIVAIMKEGTVK